MPAGTKKVVAPAAEVEDSNAPTQRGDIVTFAINFQDGQMDVSFLPSIIQ